MISIKKYLDSNSDLQFHSALDCYRAALGAMGATGMQACPDLGGSLQQSLADLQQRLSAEATPDQMVETEAGVEKELNQWARSATDYYRQRTSEFKELLLVVAGAAQAVGERDSRHEAKFREFSARLAKMADLHDLPQIRISLLASAVELKQHIEKMVEEGKTAVAELHAEVQKCNSRIQEAERTAVVEPLTGLYNRRGVESAIEFRLTQKKRFSVLMLDLNCFKKVNDTCGHLGGDQVLQQFSTELKGVFRVTDSIGRWGGDEFVVVMDSSLSEAEDYASRIKRWVFGDYTVGAAGDRRKVHVEAAMGVAEWRSGETMAQLLGRVDQAMYKQKNAK